MTPDAIAWIIPAIAIGIGLLVAMFRWPKVWIGTIILSLPWFLSDTGTGLNPSELILGVFIVGSVGGWLFVSLLTGKTRITGLGEQLMMLFLILSLTNIIVAVLNDVKPLEWLAEWFVFLLMLCYFPIKEYFGKSEQDLKQLLILLAIAILFMGAYTIYDIKMRSSTGLTYAYQLLTSRSRLFAPAFTMSFVISTAILFNTTTRRARLAVALFTFLSGLGILQSLTRSLWVASAICIAILMLFLRPRQNAVLAGSIVVIALTGYLVASTLYPRLTDIGVRMLEQRATSSTQLTGGDYSFETRLIEADIASRWIREYPLHGSGLRAELLSWGPIEQIHWRKSFIHIGYVSMLFKFGIPLTLLYLAFIAVFSGKSIITSCKVRSDRRHAHLARAVMIGSMCFFPALYISIFVAGFIDQRYGNMMFAVLFALITISGDLLKPPPRTIESQG